MIVELKNDLCIKGVLHSVDQFLNIKLKDVSVVDEDKYPHLVRTLMIELEYYWIELMKNEIEIEIDN